MADIGKTVRIIHVTEPTPAPAITVPQKERELVPA